MLDDRVRILHHSRRSEVGSALPVRDSVLLVVGSSASESVSVGVALSKMEEDRCRRLSVSIEHKPLIDRSG